MRAGTPRPSCQDVGSFTGGGTRMRSHWRKRVHRAWLLAASPLLLLGCMQGEPVEVRILPETYVVAGVRSGLATPAVDAVVAMRADAVLVRTCYTTGATKVSQFLRELAARSDAEVKVEFFEGECPSS